MDSTDLFRPSTWDDFVGQAKLKRRLDVHINASLEQRRPLEHILLTGPPGFGKTSLASIINNRLGTDLQALTMPVEDKVIVRVINQGLSHNMGTTLLLDEIHRSSRAQQESFLGLVEDGYYQDKLGRKHHAGWLTIVAATTERDKIIAPLYDRFPIKPEFEDYSDDEMGVIVRGMAVKADARLNDETCVALGRATGGVPRNAKQFVLAARDLTVDLGRTPTVEEILEFCQVDPTGLTDLHQRYVRALAGLDGRAGLKTLASMLQLNEALICQLERLLLKRQYIIPTPQGRELTGAGFQVLRELALERTA